MIAREDCIRLFVCYEVCFELVYMYVCRTGTAVEMLPFLRT